MGDVVALNDKKVSAKLAAAFGGVDDNADLSDNVSAGFGVVSFRGSKWRLKYGGEETLLTNSDGDPIPAIEMVLVKANKHVSKNYYEAKYEEGSDMAPDCYSIDGITPDESAPNKQSVSCAACPKNVFGSRMTDSGKKAKACADHRRLAVVPAGDIPNDGFGGPMLLRVPATSLTDLAIYGKGLNEKGFPYYSVITKISFDPDVSYPKPTFKAAGPLNDDQAEQVLAAMQSDRITAILAEPQEVAPTSETDEDAPTPTSEPVKKKRKTKATKPPASSDANKGEAEASVAESTGSPDELDNRLDELLGSLDNAG